MCPFSPLETTDGQRATQDVGETAVDENGLPALSIKVTDMNHHEHLIGIVRLEPLFYCVGADRRVHFSTQKRQKGVGSQAHDPAQSDIRKFFGGGGIDNEKTVLAESESDAMDGIVEPHL